VARFGWRFRRYGILIVGRSRGDETELGWLRFWTRRQAEAWVAKMQSRTLIDGAADYRVFNRKERRTPR
jgi:hypothetical protein